MKTWCNVGLCVLLGCSSGGSKQPDAIARDAAIMTVDAGTPSIFDNGKVTAQQQRLDRLSADSHHFRDSMGRAVILRGLNARVRGVFDVSFDDGRKPLEEIPELKDEDCARMAELGFTLLRLPINWSGIEPERSAYDTAYLARVDEAIACAARHGIYVLVDLHQDAYSKEIGEDGAPLWAIVPKPEMLLEGPLEDLTTRRFSKPVGAAFESFFAKGDPHGLQAAYIDMLRLVAGRYATRPFVVGLDLFNEPSTTATLLAAFQARAAKAVHEEAPDLTVVFEPEFLWTIAGSPVAAGPFAVKGSVYAPHLYRAVIGGSEAQLANITRGELLPAFETAAEEARDWGSAWLIGEFGAGPTTTNFQTYLRLHYDLQDEFGVSSALWLWKESSQDSWGLYDFVGGKWQERPVMVDVVSRPYAARIAGTPTGMRLEARTLTFSYADAINVPNVVVVPERMRVDEVTCDGSVVSTKIEGPNVEVACPKGKAHEVVLSLSTGA